ncbi:putative Growth arrest-specific protein 1 [Operophtera brumata]|uniref:Putative Growth arrest-specific protein 1 n=1 Tax=Operophtera brumata TaxID=104452 RepID=A0A0L7L0P9_OPEBR|nr:putative Growth arrest-specific protein 1 [Operophtera brumata]
MFNRERYLQGLLELKTSLYLAQSGIKDVTYIKLSRHGATDKTFYYKQHTTPCVQARTRCAYRTGCGAALSNYMMMCDAVLSEPASYCPKECSHALIALTSTEEGKELMNSLSSCRRNSQIFYSTI